MNSYEKFDENVQGKASFILEQLTLLTKSASNVTLPALLHLQQRGCSTSHLCIINSDQMY